MATVQTQQQASYSMSTSNTLGGGPGGGIGTDLNSWGLALPIAQRGLFFQDNYFQKAREHFENSVKNVLASMGQQQAFAQPLQDSLTSYRQLRCANHKEETQAVSAVEDENNYKMILDVRDFMGGDLKVNVVGDNELLVEGKLEKKEQGTLQTRTFRQRFLLPRGVDIQESSSALSSDGILTIITPKLTQETPSQSLYMVNDPRKSQSNQSQCMDGGTSQSQPMFSDMQPSQSTFTKPSHSSQSHNGQMRNSFSTTNQENSVFGNLNHPEPVFNNSKQAQPLFSDTRPTGFVFNDSKQTQSAFRDPRQSVPMFNDLGQPHPTFRGPGHAEVKFNEACSSKFTLDAPGRAPQSVSSDRSRSGQVNYGDPNSQAQYLYNSNLSHPQFSSSESTSAQTKFGNQSHPQQIFHKPSQSQMNTQQDARQSQNLYSDGVDQSPSSPSQSKDPSQQQCIFHRPNQQQTKQHSSRQPQRGYIDGSRSPFRNSVPGQSPSMLRVPGRSPYMYSDHSDQEDSFEDQDYSDTDQSDVIQHQQSIQQQQQQQQAVPVQTIRPKLMRANSHIDRNNYSLFDTEFTSGMLPILRRGYFNHDSFFQEAQKDFHRAVNDVLARSGMQTADPFMQTADPFASYRSLRAKDLKEETQATTVSEDDKAQKIVIDVQDFINDGEVNVKVVNDKELVVEGRVEKNDGGAKSMKNFKKQFALSPNTDLDSITSVVSADGVLAITIPKKVQAPKLKERKIPLLKEGPGTPQASSGASTPSALDISSQVTQSQLTQSQVSAQHASLTQSSLFNASLMQKSSLTQPASFSQPKKRDYIVPIILEDDENEELIEKELEALHVASSIVDEEVAKLGQASMVDAATSPVPTFGSIFAGMVPTAPATPVSIISPPMSPPMPTPTPTPPVFSPAPTPPISPPAPAPIVAPPAPIVAPPVPVVPVAPPALPTRVVSPPPAPPRSPAQDPARQAIINQLKDKKRGEPGPIRFPRAHGYVPVVKKGAFETDPEFENDKPEYNSAIKTALKCKGIEAPPGEEKATYKKMRKQSPNDEDVAFSFSEHNQGYKIVLDMEDYNVKDPEIQIHGDNDLVIVGVAERKDEDGEPINFRRQFVFPKSVNMEAITSAVSTDGVLTVKAPFKVARVTKVSTTDPSEPIEEDDVPSGIPLNMLVGTFLDIENRPEIFNKDPMFQEPKCHYPSAIRAAIKRSGVPMGDGETEAQCYRRIRDNERSHKNQAVMTIEGDEYYKVIVDMEDYMNTEIKVRLLGFNTFVVECYQEKNGKYKRIWSRQFVLPNHIQMEKMTAALSTDGRLVMNVPKRVWKHVGNTDASGIMRVGWTKSYPDDRIFTSDSCKTGVTTPYKTLPFKGLRDW